jgi:2-dehydro-3-deoxyphosphogalactonate aldolase
LCTVLPKEIKIFPVGGVTAEQIPGWRAAGAAGFGFGSELFRPEYSLDEIKSRAQLLVRAYLADSTTTTRTQSGETP